MQITVTLNGKKLTEEIAPDLLLIDFLRAHGCFSVKRGCETSNCGLCTVFLDNIPVLSCSVLAARADQRCVDTLEGLQEEAAEFGAFLADQGAEQCGFCNPGFFGKISHLQMMRSGRGWQETCAAAPGMKDSCGQSGHLSHGDRGKRHEVCKSAGKKKGRDGVGNRKTGIS